MAQKKKKKAKVQKKKANIILRLLKWCFVLSIWAIVMLGVAMLWFGKDLPDITNSATFDRRVSIVLKSTNGTEIARYGETKGEIIKVEDLPAYLPQAVLATEDRRFYSHLGIDIWGIGRAMVTNITKRRFAQGGSTITQQLAKNLFLTHERKITRKIKEALLAIWLEHALTKDEILSAYMNRVYLGSGTYGFEAASQLYFDKSAKDVTLREASVLAGLLKAPSKYSPHNSPKRAIERSNLVLASMIDAGYIKEDDIAKDSIALSLPNKMDTDQKTARYFTDWIISSLDEIIGTPDMDIIVETTLDIDLHTSSQKTLSDAINNADKMQFVSQGAILAMRPDGAITTMIGGYDYGQSQFNRVTQAKRPPGSAFKPIIYLTALEQHWKKTDQILDGPITEGTYKPNNFADKYYGKVPLEIALEKSMNTAAVRLCKKVGIGSVIDSAKRLGIISKLQRDLSLCLGSSGISMLEMGVVYSTFANGGFRIYPYGINRVITPDGRVLYERKPPSKLIPIIAKKEADDLSIMLRRVVEYGTGKNAKQMYPVHGKTGTSQDNRDAWFAGYTDRSVAIVWLGNDDNSPMRGVTGGGLPARIFRTVINAANRTGTHIRFPENKRDDDAGIKGLLRKLLSTSSAPKKVEKKDPFSNLNN